jgi:predicted nucleic acid-binding protein
MEFLIDTNIISELTRKTPDAGVTKFMIETPRLLVSTILFHELSYGLEIAQPEQKLRLASFIAAMKNRFGPRAIPVTLEIAETAGQLRGLEKSAGRILTVSDSMMAATAIVKSASLVTRNVKDFKNLGIEIVNPFEDQ